MVRKRALMTTMAAWVLLAALISTSGVLVLLWLPGRPLEAAPAVMGTQSVRAEGGYDLNMSLTACTYYVAPTGNDHNPGTAEAPWRTIQHAADTMQPGDTVCLRGGVYHQYVRLKRSGTSGQPITYAAYPGETVWLDGQGMGAKYAFDLGDPGASYINIVGLNMRHWHDETGDGACIISWRDSDYVTVRDAELHHCGHGAIALFQKSDYITVVNVYIHDNTLVGMDCGIGPCTHWVLRKVRAINNGSESGNTAADGIAIEDGDAILVEDCEASGNAGDGFDFKSTGTTLRRVIARGNDRDNIKLWGQRSSLINGLSVDAGLDGLVLAGGGSYTVINSLIANRQSYGYLAEFGADDYAAVTPVRLYNTIFFNDNPVMGGTTVYFSAKTQLQADHNLYYNPYREDAVICASFLGEDACFSGDQINDGTWFDRSGQEEHSAYGDPLFLNAPGKDFHLTAGSPAVDAGTAAWAPSNDLERRPRPVGKAPDLGPYEYRTANALRNGSFEKDGLIPKPWRAKGLTLNDGRVCNTAHDGSCSFRMLGSSATKSLEQVVNISGSAGDEFTLSGWSKAQNPLPEGGPYCLQARVFHTDGTKKTYRTCFTKTTHGWQYRSKTFIVAKEYNKIVVLLFYNGQSGRAWFDGVRLVASPVSLRKGQTGQRSLLRERWEGDTIEGRGGG